MGGSNEWFVDVEKYDIITKIKTPIMKKNVDGIQNIKDFCEKMI